MIDFFVVPITYQDLVKSLKSVNQFEDGGPELVHFFTSARWRSREVFLEVLIRVLKDQGVRIAMTEAAIKLDQIVVSALVLAQCTYEICKLLNIMILCILLLERLEHELVFPPLVRTLFFQGQ